MNDELWEQCQKLEAYAATLPVPTKTVDPAESELMTQLSSVNIHPKAIRLIHESRLSSDQIMSLKQSVYDVHVVDGTRKTTADRLVYQLENHPSMTFTLLTATQDNQGLITIRNERRAGGITTSELLPNLADGTKLAKQIMDITSIANGTKVLLCAMWATDAGVTYFTKFPHVLGLDATVGTDEERFPLVRGIGKNMLRHNFTVFNCFLPIRAQWVWSWIFKEGIRHILARKYLKQSELSSQMTTLNATRW